MIILRQKEYSAAGRIWAGTKGAVKGAATGAMLGAVLVPGNLIALMIGKKKLAAELTLGGAVIGAGLGGYSGYKSSVDEYKFDEKLKTPEGRKELIEEESERIKNEALEAKRRCPMYDPKDWIERYKRWFSKEGVQLPEEIYKWFKLYKDFYRSSVNLFYDDLIKNPKNYIDEENLKDPYLIWDFSDVFFFPADPSLLNSFDDSLFSEVQFTISENPDIGLAYNYGENYFEVIGCRKQYSTLKETLLSWVKEFEKDFKGKQKEVLKKYVVSVINKL